MGPVTGFVWVESANANLAAVVNPNRESGRVTLITRYGAAKVYIHKVA